MRDLGGFPATPFFHTLGLHNAAHRFGAQLLLLLRTGSLEVAQKLGLRVLGHHALPL